MSTRAWYWEPQFAQATCTISTLCALLCNLKTGTLLYSGFQNYIANCTNLKYLQKRHRKRLTGKQYWGHISTHLEFKFKISTNIMICWPQTQLYRHHIHTLKSNMNTQIIYYTYTHPHTPSPGTFLPEVAKWSSASKDSSLGSNTSPASCTYTPSSLLAERHTQRHYNLWPFHTHTALL